MAKPEKIGRVVGNIGGIPPSNTVEEATTQPKISLSDASTPTFKSLSREDWDNKDIAGLKEALKRANQIPQSGTSESEKLTLSDLKKELGELIDELKLVAEIEQEIKTSIKDHPTEDLAKHIKWLKTQLGWPIFQTTNKFFGLRDKIKNRITEATEMLENSVAPEASEATPEKTISSPEKKFDAIIADAERRIIEIDEEREEIFRKLLVLEMEKGVSDVQKPTKESQEIANVEYLDVHFLANTIKEFLLMNKKIKNVALDVGTTNDPSSFALSGRLTLSGMGLGKFAIGASNIEITEAELTNAGNLISMTKYKTNPRELKKEAQEIITQNFELLGMRLKEFLEKNKNKLVADLAIKDGKIKVTYK